MIQTRIIRIFLIASAALLLLSMLAYPFGYDQAAFMVAGEMGIKHGAVTYRDFLDTKPPLIFVIYGLASLIFGHHEWSIRAFDILYHIASLFVLYKVFKRVLADETVAFTSVILYVFFYVTSGYWMTAQAETFALLPALLLFSATESAARGKSPLRNGLIAGVFGAILFLLKFTFLAVPAASVIYVLLAPRSEEKSPQSRYILGLGLGLIASLGLYLGYLVSTGAYDRFMESLKWLQDYSAINPLLSYDTIIDRFFKIFPIGLLVSFGLSSLLISAIGIDACRSKLQRSSRAYIHLGLQLGFALLAVMYERKFFPYHYSRAYWAFVPFMAVGLIKIIKRISDQLRDGRSKNISQKMISYGLLTSAILAGLFFSPVPRIISQPFHWVYAQLSGQDVAKSVEDGYNKYFYKEQITLADSLGKTLQPNDQLFLWGNSVGLYFRTGKYPTTLCLTNTPFVSPWTPTSWKRSVISSLQATPPKIIISEFGDERSYITGDTLDSWQHLQQWPELRSFVETNYAERPTIGHFRIFERK